MENIVLLNQAINNGLRQHPVYSRIAWKLAVENDQTTEGYWDWVRTRIAQKAARLAKAAAV